MRDTWLKAITNGNYTLGQVLPKFMLKNIILRLLKHKRDTRNGSGRTYLIKIRIQNTKKAQHMVKEIHTYTIMYTDQMVCFPIQSSRGNILLMILFEVDGNYINA